MSHSLFAKKTCPKSMFRGYPSPPPPSTLINVVPLSTRLVQNRKTQHCPGGAGEGAICVQSLKSTLKHKSVSKILMPIVDADFNKHNKVSFCSSPKLQRHSCLGIQTINVTKCPQMLLPKLSYPKLKNPNLYPYLNCRKSGCCYSSW